MSYVHFINIHKCNQNRTNEVFTLLSLQVIKFSYNLINI